MKNKEKSKKKRSKKMLFIIPAVIILGIVGLYLYADNAPRNFQGLQ